MRLSGSVLKLPLVVVEFIQVIMSFPFHVDVDLGCDNNQSNHVIYVACQNNFKLKPCNESEHHLHYGIGSSAKQSPSIGGTKVQK